MLARVMLGRGRAIMSPASLDAQPTPPRPQSPLLLRQLACWAVHPWRCRTGTGGRQWIRYNHPQVAQVYNT